MARREILILTDSRGGGLESDIQLDLHHKHPDLNRKIDITVHAIGGNITYCTYVTRRGERVLRAGFVDE